MLYFYIMEDKTKPKFVKYLFIFSIIPFIINIIILSPSILIFILVCLDSNFQPNKTYEFDDINVIYYTEHRGATLSNIDYIAIVSKKEANKKLSRLQPILGVDHSDLTISNVEYNANNKLLTITFKAPPTDITTLRTIYKDITIKYINTF